MKKSSQIFVESDGKVETKKMLSTARMKSIELFSITS